MRTRGQSGQATTEYVAVIMVVSIVLLVVGAVTLPGSPLGATVLGAMRRAVCMVGGNSCGTAGSSPYVPARACVRSARDRRISATVEVAGSFGAELQYLRERRSDGTVAVSLVASPRVGLKLGLGADVHAEAGGADLTAGGEAAGRVGADGQLRGQWVFENGREADSFLRHTRDYVRDQVIKRTPAGPFWDLFSDADDYRFPKPASVELRAGADLKFKADVLGMDAEGKVQGLAGARHDLRTGETTLSLIGSVSGRGDVGEILTQGISGEGEGSVSLVLDRHGRPSRLVVIGSAGYRGHLPAGMSEQDGGGFKGVKQLLQKGLDRSERGQKVEVRAELDLTRGDDARELALDLVRALQPGAAGVDPAGVLRAARVLGDRLDREAVLSVETYRTHERKLGAGAQGRAVVGVGFDASVAGIDSELTDARYRVPGLGFVEWTSCSGKATA